MHNFLCAPVVQWIELRFPKPPIRVRFPAGVRWLNFNRTCRIGKRHFLHIISENHNIVDMNGKTKGYLLGIIAAATYGMNPLFALPLYQDGVDTDSVLFFRYLFAILIVGTMTKMRGRSLKLSREEIWPLAMMGFLAAFSSLTLFMSYHYMAAGIASTILFVYPILVALIMVAFFKEKLTLQTVLCIILALSGIGLLYKNEQGDTLDATGIAFVMASALSYAVYIVGANRPALRRIPTVKLTFYVLVFGFLLFIATTRGGTALVLPQKWYLWFNFFALALFPTAVSFFCTTLAVHYIGSTPTAILGALEPVVAVIFGVTLFGEPFTQRIMIGIIVIIVAVTLVIAGGSVTTALVRFRKLFPRVKRKR